MAEKHVRRKPGKAYRVFFERVPLRRVARETRHMPAKFINRAGNDVTRAFLRMQGREDVWVELSPDADAVYDETFELDLSALKPLVAMPGMPDNVYDIEDVVGTKIDQVFIRNADLDGRDGAIISSIIDMCHKLRIEAVAEGVENKESLQFLRDRNCHVAQGFYLSPPLPAEKLEDMLNYRNG